MYADIEDKLENICYLHLIRKYGQQNIFLGRDDKGKEIDFVVKRTDDSLLAVQVCYELNDNNLKREISSLNLLKKHINNPENEYRIITMYNILTKPITEKIEIINLIDFLLE